MYPIYSYLYNLAIWYVYPIRRPNTLCTTLLPLVGIGHYTLYVLDDLLCHYMAEHGIYVTVIGEEKWFYGIFHCWQPLHWWNNRGSEASIVFCSINYCATLKTKECKAACSETASPNIATFPTPLSSRVTIQYHLNESWGINIRVTYLTLAVWQSVSHYGTLLYASCFIFGSRSNNQNNQKTRGRNQRRRDWRGRVWRDYSLF